MRPKPGAPVSTPLEWEELTDAVQPRDFTMAIALDRAKRLGDLFESVPHAEQALAAPLRELRRHAAG